MEKRTIGTFLCALRKANGLTQKQLAEKLNVSDKAVSRWERDECAPDLSLIPVLAEIYGVTSDEILRGQRRDPDAPIRDSDTVKVEKQRRRLIANTRMKFNINSVISVAIAIVGLISACICNFGLYQAEIGLMVGSTFYLVAAVCQIIFTILGRAAISDEEYHCEATADCKSSMVFQTEWILSGIVVLFALTLPLAGYSQVSLVLSSWISDSIPYIVAAALLCVLACVCINWRLGYLNAPKNRLRLRCGAILAVSLVVILITQVCVNGFLNNNRHLYTGCTQLDSLEAFLEHMETATDPEGKPMEFLYTLSNPDSDGKRYYFQSETGDYYTLSSIDFEDTLFTAETPDGYTYHRFNLTVDSYECSDGNFPIYAFTHEQAANADLICQWINIGFALLYITTIAGAIVTYNKKMKKL